VSPPDSNQSGRLRHSSGSFGGFPRLDPNHWRAEYAGGGSGMFREADIRAYDAERIETAHRA
jgi:hypothetical protein